MTVTAVGAPGTVAGVTAVDALEKAEVPAELVAETLNVYAVPFVSPVTVALVVAIEVDQLVQDVPESEEYSRA